MSEAALKALARACHDQRLDRRGFLTRATALGFSGTAAGLMLNAVSTEALAQDSGVDFMKHKGKSLKLLLNKHPYVDAMIKNIENFKALTGLNVAYDIFPEDVYFDKVTAALASKSSQYDAFMTGAYQTWKYGPARQIVDLNPYLKDAKLTSANYAWDDIYQNLRAATAWDGKAGSELGGAGAKQWAVPWGFELNSLAYNRRIFDALKISAPTNLGDMAEKAAVISKSGKGYGIGVRGSRSWATIHAGFLSAYTNFGNKDFTSAGGKLVPAMNTPESKKFHQQWIDMVKNGGPKNWTNYTWYEVGNDLGAGNSAMIYDADILGYFMNGSGNKEAGNLGLLGVHAEPRGQGPDAQHLDLVAGDERVLQAEGSRLVLHAVGHRHAEHHLRRHQGRPGEPDPQVGVGEPRVQGPPGEVVPRLPQAIPGQRGGRQDLLHAAAAVP